MQSLVMYLCNAHKEMLASVNGAISGGEMSLGKLLLEDGVDGINELTPTPPLGCWAESRATERGLLTPNLLVVDENALVGSLEVQLESLGCETNL